MLEFIRRILPYTAILCGLAALYLAWTFVSRWNANHAIQQAEETKRVEAAKQTVDLLGAGEVKILNFYASPASLSRGEKGRLCYGVANAKTVRLEPDVERVWPSLARCFEIAPRGETTYTLTAEDGKGHTQSQSLAVKVK